LISYYRSRGLLHDIDSSRSVAHSEAQILEVLSSLGAKKS
jgi:hypothetical protein